MTPEEFAAYLIWYEWKLRLTHKLTSTLGNTVADAPKLYTPTLTAY